MEDVKRLTIRSLVSKLSSVSEQTRTEALRELRLMTKTDPETRPIIAESGAIPYLAETLYSSSHPSQENAAATLLNLSITAREPLIATRGLLDAISHVLSNHRSAASAAPSAVQSAAATLHSLLLIDDYRPVVGSKRDIVYALVDILRNPNSPPRSLKDALKALFGISLCQQNRATMVQLGAVPALFALVLNDGRVGIVEDATAVIAQVAGCDDGAEEFRKVSGVGVLVDLLDLATGSSMRTKENAVSALLNLVRFGEESVAVELREVAVEALDGIADVEDRGSAKGKSKASALLKVLLDDDDDDDHDHDGGESNDENVLSHSRFDSDSSLISQDSSS